MDISHNHHHHISPLAVAAAVVGVSMLALTHNGYLQHAFHKEIMASINPADVLTPADMIPEQPGDGTPVHYRPITASVH
ncbi:hypothetical protein QD460_12320 [Rhizobium jaguaris]|uniref:Uncharacterized protein n=1 Tax=Rhizobium jaguaris TaxID=1312183 RepID=A0A387FV86_9HYPH|nr:hypothetical protein [Rhizobium jaguaris]AYG59362.1 hypothetical protein CCGE525_11595 [Rhizobium jaguaris]